MRSSRFITAVTPALVALLSVTLGGPPALGASRPASALPPGFRGQSQSWVSPDHGFMLGLGPCGQSTCTSVIGTTDGGATWSPLGTINAPIVLEKDAGITELRFADDLHGWAFGPAMWATRDGGFHWRRQIPPGNGRRILALAGNADAVYAVISPCRINHVCTGPATLWRTTPTDGVWTQVPMELPASIDAVVAVRGVVAYVVVQDQELVPDVLEVTLDGQTWSPRPDPCNTTQNEYLVDVAPYSDTDVAFLCVANIGFSQAEKRVFRSKDTGQTTSGAGMMPLLGITSSLAAAPNGTLTVESWSDGSWIYRNAGGKVWTTPESIGDGGLGWNDIVMVSNRVGFVVYAPVRFPGTRPGQLWKTEDGGVTWASI